jgi:hypothetical protein
MSGRKVRKRWDDAGDITQLQLFVETRKEDIKIRCF